MPREIRAGKLTERATQPTTDDNATEADGWSASPTWSVGEPVPMAPLPTVAPYNQVVPTPGAGPSAEGQAGTGPSRIGSARRVSPQSSIKSRLFTFDLSTGKSRNFAEKKGS